MRTVTASIIEIKSRNASRNGNPRYDIVTTHGTLQTQTDAAINYDVDNIASAIKRGTRIRTFYLTPNGRVWDIRKEHV